MGSMTILSWTKKYEWSRFSRGGELRGLSGRYDGDTPRGRGASLSIKHTPLLLRMSDRLAYGGAVGAKTDGDFLSGKEDTGRK